MRKKKIIYDLIFVLVSGIFLTVLDKYGLLQKYIGFALIPLLISYYTGQIVERKFTDKK
nr:hypothetical protein [uncultured Marinifilum sp.]